MKGTKTLLSYILFIVGAQYKVVCSLPPCEDEQFRCKNGDCIPQFWHCDSSDDCGDNSDEEQCVVKPAREECDTGEWKCGNGKCVDTDWRCDGEDDCSDNTDETNCTATHRSRPCDLTANFRCGNGKCIPRSLTCNKIDDCGDNTDESKDSGPKCTPYVGCKKEYFQCKKSGYCIHKVLVCDGIHFNCGAKEQDDSDELLCVNSTCGPVELRCDNGRCISKHWRCDKHNDCGDNSDERNCSIRISPSTPIPQKKKTVPQPIKTTKNPSGADCGKLKYKCQNEDKCIDLTWICDGDPDCKGMDDESPRVCSTHKCQPNHYKCANNKCISMKNRCDGIHHCSDGSDEVNCKAVHVRCSNDTHRCIGGKCIPASSVCDKRMDCPHNDDEGPACGINECIRNNGNCSHKCTDLPQGFKCECPRGYEMDSTGRKCVDINECHVFGKCSQSCKNYKGSFACQCDKGYSMDEGEKRTCRADGPMAQLFFTNDFDIRSSPLNGRSTKLIRRVQKATAIAYHFAQSIIFWADIGLKSISRTSLDKESKVEVVVSNVGKPESLAVDWLTNKLYWTDLSLNRIGVCNLDGLYSKVLYQGGHHEEIRSLALFPEKGYIFWTNWGGNSKIERAHLDGSSKRTIVSQHLTWPASIAIDKTKNRLYWTELSSICSVGINGESFRKIIYGLSRPYGLAVFEDSIFWSDFVDRVIYRANKFTGLEKHKFNASYTAPLDLLVYHPFIQSVVIHPCREGNGGCSHFCFMKPGGKSLCDCPARLNLRPDNKTCFSSQTEHKSISHATQNLATSTSEQVEGTPTTWTVQDVRRIELINPISTSVHTERQTAQVGNDTVMQASKQFLPFSATPTRTEQLLSEAHIETTVKVGQNPSEASTVHTQATTLPKTTGLVPSERVSKKTVQEGTDTVLPTKLTLKSETGKTKSPYTVTVQAVKSKQKVSKTVATDDVGTEAFSTKEKGKTAVFPTKVIPRTKRIQYSIVVAQAAENKLPITLTTVTKMQNMRDVTLSTNTVKAEKHTFLPTKFIAKRVQQKGGPLTIAGEAEKEVALSTTVPNTEVVTTTMVTKTVQEVKNTVLPTKFIPKTKRNQHSVVVVQAAKTKKAIALPTTVSKRELVRSERPSRKTVQQGTNALPPKIIIMTEVGRPKSLSTLTVQAVKSKEKVLKTTKTTKTTAYVRTEASTTKIEQEGKTTVLPTKFIPKTKRNQHSIVVVQASKTNEAITLTSPKTEIEPSGRVSRKTEVIPTKFITKRERGKSETLPTAIQQVKSQQVVTSVTGSGEKVLVEESSVVPTNFLVETKMRGSVRTESVNTGLVTAENSLNSEGRRVLSTVGTLPLSYKSEKAKVVLLTVPHPCQVKNGGCSHHCFNTPSGNVTCDCPTQMQLSLDLRTCVGKRNPSTKLLPTPEAEVSSKRSDVTTVSNAPQTAGDKISEIPSVVVNAGVRSDKRNRTTMYVVVTLCILILCLVIFAVFYYRKRKSQMDLRMIYETQGEKVMQEEEKYSFGNVNFTTAGGMPLSVTTDTAVNMNESSPSNSSEDICFSDREPIMAHML